MQSKLSGGSRARCSGSTLQSRIPGSLKSTVCQASNRDAAAAMIDRRSLLVATASATLLTAAAGGDQDAIAAPAKVQNAGDWSSPGLAAPEDDALPKFFKTASGVRVQQLSEGSGDAVVQPGDAVLIDYVLRRNNGYFIYGTIEGVSFQPRDVPVGPVRLQLGSGEVIEGLEDALIGMNQGGKRRVLIPPELGYVSSVLQPQPPTFATKRQLANHSSESLLFEIELLRVIPA